MLKNRGMCWILHEVCSKGELRNEWGEGDNYNALVATKSGTMVEGVDKLAIWSGVLSAPWGGDAIVGLEVFA